MTIDKIIAEAVGDALRTELPQLVRAAVREAIAASPPAACEYLTTEQAAAHAKVHPETLREWIRAGHIPEHRAGRSLRIRRDELDGFLDGHSQRAGRSGGEAEAWASAVVGRHKAGG